MYRTFQNGDEVGIVELWNEVLNRDPLNARRFRKQILLDANFDPKGLIVAVDKEEIVGAILAITRKLPMEGTNLESDTGWISFFMVERSYERNGIGHQLVKQACQYLIEQGAEKVFFSSYAPNYFLPGIDEAHYPKGYAFLLKEGFKKVYSPVAMHRALTDYEYPLSIQQLKKKREKEGYSFASVQDGDFYELIQFANVHFNPDWGRAIREGALQSLDPSQIIVAKKQHQIVGFVLYGGYEGIRERFGPFGVDESEQGKGLGKILLHETLQTMRKQTILGAWFLWTSETSAAGHLYLKNGFQTFRKFHVMVKELTNE
ncbi:GNAT family N-acetyltransferase [Psychrobacillus sp. FSL H8-0483]|uniref:GNAT family N-acetyltransferase n=1 Tax=Psychrobacillus sp. FSL H8-0483 TaxID=2921389 RepID=UPI00315A96E8